jgi:sn-glycerol 3-phosphate transport system permease protein
MKRPIFQNRLLPWLLLAPQLAITAVFFLCPAGQAMWQSFLRQDAFGFRTTFVGWANYIALWNDPLYLASFRATLIFSVSVTVLAMGVALILAVAVDRLIRTGSTYTTLVVWPYAVAPAVAGILWWFMFNPTIGILAYVLKGLGVNWNHQLNPGQAMTLIVIAAAWKQVSYNFLFFVAGLQSIPASLREAAAIDGAGPVKRFFTITLPLLAPTTFFLLVVNIVYAMFDTFPVVDATTEGGPV